MFKSKITTTVRAFGGIKPEIYADRNNLAERIDTGLLHVKIYKNHTDKKGFWLLLGIPFKISNDHLRAIRACCQVLWEILKYVAKLLIANFETKLASSVPTKL